MPSATQARSFGERLVAKQAAAEEAAKAKKAAEQEKAKELDVWDPKTKSVKKQKSDRQFQIGGEHPTRRDPLIRGGIAAHPGLRPGESAKTPIRAFLSKGPKGTKLTGGAPPEQGSEAVQAWAEKQSANLRKRRDGESHHEHRKRVSRLDAVAAKAKEAHEHIEAVELWLCNISTGQASVEEAAFSVFNLGESPSFNDACSLFEAAVSERVSNNSLFERVLATV